MACELGTSGLPAFSTPPELAIQVQLIPNKATRPNIEDEARMEREAEKYRQDEQSKRNADQVRNRLQKSLLLVED